KYLRQLHQIPEHIPVNLWAIVDPADGSRPNPSLRSLAQLAIYGSDSRMLQLHEICEEFMARFTWYNANRNDSAWKNSLRHTLSRHQAFRLTRNKSRARCWTLDLSSGDGLARPDKKIQMNLRAA
ncbi:hypothetical protein C8R43DRAFT_883342, partial [Mycena crocata]